MDFTTTLVHVRFYLQVVGRTTVCVKTCVKSFVAPKGASDITSVSADWVKVEGILGGSSYKEASLTDQKHLYLSFVACGAKLSFDQIVVC